LCAHAALAFLLADAIALAGDLVEQVEQVLAAEFQMQISVVVALELEKLGLSFAVGRRFYGAG
jgi:hypothetical protein